MSSHSSAGLFKVWSWISCRQIDIPWYLESNVISNFNSVPMSSGAVETTEASLIFFIARVNVGAKEFVPSSPSTYLKTNKYISHHHTEEFWSSDKYQISISLAALWNNSFVNLRYVPLFTDNWSHAVNGVIQQLTPRG